MGAASSVTGTVSKFCLLKSAFSRSRKASLTAVVVGSSYSVAALLIAPMGPPSKAPPANASVVLSLISPFSKSLPASASVPIKIPSCAASVILSALIAVVNAAATRPPYVFCICFANAFVPSLPISSFGNPFTKIPRPMFSSTPAIIPPL